MEVPPEALKVLRDLNTEQQAYWFHFSTPVSPLASQEELESRAKYTKLIERLALKFSGLMLEAYKKEHPYGR